MKINALQIFQYPKNVAFGEGYKTEEKKSPNIRALLQRANILQGGGENNDTFSREIITTQMANTSKKGTIKGTRVKSIPLKDASGRNIKGFIIQKTGTENCFYACTKENALCRMEMVTKNKPYGGYIYIDALFGQGNDGKIKGAGTELLKFAAQKSMDKGFEGRLELTMAGSSPFYYKNNFRTGRGYPEHLRMDAVLDYTKRHNLPKTAVWDKSIDSSPVMILDERGAKALLEGRRLCDEEKSETMYGKKITYGSKGKTFEVTVDIDFCDFSKSDPEQNAYVIQAVLKKEDFYMQLAALEMRLSEDGDGKKFLDIKNIYTNDMDKSLKKTVLKELFKAAKTKADELGAEHIKYADEPV